MLLQSSTGFLCKRVIGILEVVASLNIKQEAKECSYVPCWLLQSIGELLIVTRIHVQKCWMEVAKGSSEWKWRSENDERQMANGECKWQMWSSFIFRLTILPYLGLGFCDSFCDGLKGGERLRPANYTWKNCFFYWHGYPLDRNLSFAANGWLGAAPTVRCFSWCT